MSDPRRWDRFDRTRPWPFTRKRLAWWLADRSGSILLFAGFLVIILFAALHAPTRESRTLFGLAFGACLLVVAESAPVAG